MNAKFDASRTLERLKDFQRRTVDYIDRRLFLDPNPARRFLVADEVGLGKTLVARGVIAKVIERLQDQVKRIDIIYVCSNAAIASQNIGRLNISSQPGFALASRLTLLPLHVHNLQGNAINFISFTPATTFDLRSRGGTQEERRLLYQMLLEEPGVNPRGLLRLLQATVGDGWFTYAKEVIKYDAGLAERYRESLLSEKTSSLRSCLQT